MELSCGLGGTRHKKEFKTMMINGNDFQQNIPASRWIRFSVMRDI